MKDTITNRSAQIVGSFEVKRRKHKRCAGDTVMGICVDCQQPSLARNEYLVRSSIWMQCGMGTWESGYLHRECLEKRLGRELADDDLIVVVKSETHDAVALAMHPDYYTSSDYRPGKRSRNCLAPPNARLFRPAPDDNVDDDE